MAFRLFVSFFDYLCNVLLVWLGSFGFTKRNFAFFIMGNSLSDNDKKQIHIDVKKVLETKLPALKGKVPNFVIQNLRRIVHEEEMNNFFRDHGELMGMDFATYFMLDYLNITIEKKCEERLPDNGRVIFACNHPIGSIDGIALIIALGQKYGTLKIPVNDLLLNIVNLQEFFIPVNKVSNEQSRNMSEMLNAALASDDPILFFPSGQCSRRQDDGSIRDNEWKKTFVSKAREYKRDVVPLYFEGKNSNFFYRLAYYRKKLGIKANIEMLYLADEMFKQKNNKFTITVGNSIPYSTFDDSKSDREWAAYVKEITYSLINDK